MKRIVLGVWRLVLGVFVFGVLGLAAIAYFSGERPGSTAAVAEASTKGSTQAEWDDFMRKAAMQPVVSIKQLNQDYDENKLNADAKYKGKIIRIQGLVDSVNRQGEVTIKTLPTNQKNSMLDPVGAFEEGVDNETAKVYANFYETESAKLPQLRKNQKLDIVCVGDGTSFERPDFKNCVFVEPVKKVTAGVYQTSFDCSKVKSGSSEDTICHDAALAEADVKLDARLKQIMADRKVDPASLKQEMRTTWNDRAKCGTDYDCLINWYQEWDTSLNMQMQTAAPQKNIFQELREGRQKAWDEADRKQREAQAVAIAKGTMECSGEGDSKVCYDKTAAN
jgi:uncharacterized protein